MLETDAIMYLPLSESTLLTLLEDSTSWKSTLQELDAPEIASLFLLAHLPELQTQKHIEAERLLAEIVEACIQQVDNSSLAELVEYALQHLELKTVDAGFHLLLNFRIGFMDEETVKRRAYLSYSGSWDYSFQSQYRQEQVSQRVSFTVDSNHRTLSAEQSRVYHEFESQKDEHMHIQGYAGTGKSFLIKSLLSMFKTSAGQVLVLASSKRQLDALSIDARHFQHVHKRTFTELAEMVIPPDSTVAANRNMLGKYGARATMPDDIIVRQLGVKSSGEHSTDQIIMAIRATVYNFCQSEHEHILQRHIPNRFTSVFDTTLQAVVCQYAKSLWNTLLSTPTKDFKPQIRGYHKVKWAALNDWAIPESYTHILVDECHDLPRTVLQILARGPQARSTLGDDYQNLKGRTFRQSGNTRLREMVHSVRSGHDIEKIVNPIIAVHPSSMKARFEGNRFSTLEVQYYQKAAVPEVRAVILVNDIWGLFEWVQRLASKGINPALLTDHKDLDMFVQDCIELKSGGSRARHGELFRFNSWNKVANIYQYNPNFRRFNQLLEKGYDHNNWKQTYSRLTHGKSHTYAVSLVQQVRNQEFDNVMLTSDIFNGMENKSKAAFGSTIYVGVTRARKRLIVPESLRHWIEDISETGWVDRKANRRTKA